MNTTASGTDGSNGELPGQHSVRIFDDGWKASGSDLFEIAPIGGRFPDEKKLADAVTYLLSPWFTITREVRGTHWTGKRMRLDAILSPLDRSTWRGTDPVYLGLEFKLDRFDFFRQSAQAVDYAQTTWQDYGQIPVFICPGIRESARKPEVYPFACRFLGRFNVGELNNEAKYGFTFRKSHSIVWGQHPQWYWKGHCPNNQEIVRSKWGSR